MPLFLLPFIVLAAGNTRMHKTQADAAMMEAQTRRAEYELHLAEFQAKCHIKSDQGFAPRAQAVVKPSKPAKQYFYKTDR